MSGQHGFARILKWNPLSENRTESSCTFALKDDENTLKFWPHKFLLLYTVSLTLEGLHVRIEVQNCDEFDFQFTALLHTYFNIQSIDSVTIVGLKNLKFSDKLKNNEIFTEFRDLIDGINEEVDRNYFNVPGPVQLKSLTGEFQIESDFKDLGNLLCVLAK